MESEISDVVPTLHVITGYGTTSYKFNVEKVQFSKKRSVYKEPSSLTFIKMLRLNITLIEKLSKRQKIFVEAIIYNGKLNENCLPTKVRLYKNLKPKSSMLLPLNPDSLVEKLKRVHLPRYVWLNALKATLS